MSKKKWQQKCPEFVGRLSADEFKTFREQFSELDAFKGTIVQRVGEVVTLMPLETFATLLEYSLTDGDLHRMGWSAKFAKAA